MYIYLNTYVLFSIASLLDQLTKYRLDEVLIRKIKDNIFVYV